MIKILGREPAAWVAAVGAILTALAAFHVEFLSAGQAAAITGAVSALVMALTTRPVAPSVVTGVVTAGAALLAEYGLHAPEGAVAAISAAALAVFALISREQVAPRETVVTRS